MITALHHMPLNNRLNRSVDTPLTRLATAAFDHLSQAVNKVFSAGELQKLTRFEEAEKLRGLAWRVRNESGFSDDLLAAAARYEGLND